MCETVRNCAKLARNSCEANRETLRLTLLYQRISPRLPPGVTGHAPMARNHPVNLFLGCRDNFQASKSSLGPQNGLGRCSGNVAGQCIRVRICAKLLRSLRIHVRNCGKDPANLRETPAKLCEFVRTNLRNCELDPPCVGL